MVLNRYNYRKKPFKKVDLNSRSKRFFPKTREKAEKTFMRDKKP